MPETDLQLLLDVAEKAGKIANGFFQSDPQVWDKDDNAGPVTEADLAVNAMMMDRLRSARPDYGWLSEEDEDGTERLTTKRQFVVDPIDGTRAFISGSKDWAHAIAVLEDGIPVAAVVALPQHGVTYHAVKGQGAFCNGQPIQVSDATDLCDATILSKKPNLQANFWQGGCAPDFEMAFRSSLAYRLCLAADGSFDAMLTLRGTWEWDIAAGVLILQEAGGKATDMTGADFKFNNPKPKVNGCIAGTPKIVDEVLSALA